MVLEEYKDLVGNAASICNIGQMFSGIFICRDIVRQGSTKNISVVPFLGGLAMGSVMMAYALMLNDNAMIRVNVVGLVLNLGYFLCYYYYARDKDQVGFQTMQAAGFVMLVFGYIRFESPDAIEFRLGLVVTVLLMFLIASPLFSLGEIVRTQSSETLPFPLIASGTVVTILWLLYGIIIDNFFIQVQNGVGLALLVVQLALFVIYPSKPSAKTPGKKQEKAKSNKRD